MKIYELIGDGEALASIAIIAANSKEAAKSIGNKLQKDHGLKEDMRLNGPGKETDLKGSQQTLFYWNGDY